MNTDYYVVIPNWNGIDLIRDCLDSLREQTLAHQVIVVDNGSVDGSNEVIRKEYPEVELLEFPNNAGFSGGVNRGIRPAIEHGASYIALLNNDAVADSNWLEKLVAMAEANPQVGVVTSKILKQDRVHLDSTGDMYSISGLPFPRGRNEVDHGQYDDSTQRLIFAGSGGASLYRVEMLKEIGLFDERFFAYYEDSDIGFRGQLAGWKMMYEPAAKVYHYVSATSSRIDNYGKKEPQHVAPQPQHENQKPSAFTRRHSVKNIIYLYTKNMPERLYWKYLPHFWLSLMLLLVNDIGRGLAGSYFKGMFAAIVHLPQILVSRHKIQSNRAVSVSYIDSILWHDWPPIQKEKIEKLRKKL